MVLFRIVPEWVIPGLAKILAEISYYIIPYRKSIIKKQLKLAFPKKTEKEIVFLTKANYKHLILFIFEFILLFKWKNEKVVSMTTLPAEISEQLKLQGGVLLSGHLGNWEVFTRALSILNFPLSVIMKRQKNYLVNDLIDKWRNNVGMEIIYTGGALKKSLMAIQNQRTICIMGDQDAKKRGIFSSFFNQPSSTHVGAALMAYKYDKVVIGFGLRRKFKEYYTDIYPVNVKELKQKTHNDKEQFIQEFIDLYNKILETVIRKHPEQYFWFHKRWKTPYQGKKIIDY